MRACVCERVRVCVRTCEAVALKKLEISSIASRGDFLTLFSRWRNS